MPRALPPGTDARVLEAALLHGASALAAIGRHASIDPRTAAKIVARLRPRIEAAQRRRADAAAEEERKLALQRAAATEDADQVAAKEVLAARGVRGIALDLVNRTMQLKAYADRAAQRLASLELKPDVHPLEVVRVLNALARYAQRASEVTEAAIRLERLRIGEARKIDLTVRVGQQEPVDEAAVEAEARAYIASLERERAAAVPALAAGAAP